jgi:hypothetical protein
MSVVALNKGQKAGGVVVVKWLSGNGVENCSVDLLGAETFLAWRTADSRVAVRHVARGPAPVGRVPGMKPLLFSARLYGVVWTAYLGLAIPNCGTFQYTPYALLDVSVYTKDWPPRSGSIVPLTSHLQLRPTPYGVTKTIPYSRKRCPPSAETE